MPSRFRPYHHPWPSCPVAKTSSPARSMSIWLSCEAGGSKSAKATTTGTSPIPAMVGSSSGPSVLAAWSAPPPCMFSSAPPPIHKVGGARRPGRLQAVGELHQLPQDVLRLFEVRRALGLDQLDLHQHLLVAKALPGLDQRDEAAVQHVLVERGGQLRQLVPLGLRRALQLHDEPLQVLQHEIVALLLVGVAVGLFGLDGAQLVLELLDLRGEFL